MPNACASPPTFRLLNASIDPDGSGDIRILVNGTSIKYISIESDIYDPQDLCFEPSLLTLLPPLPEGDWNEALLAREASTGTVSFSRLEKAKLPGIEQLWHPVTVEYLDLRIGKKLRSNVYEVQCDVLSGTVIAKYARFDWEVPFMAAETEIYRRIQGHDIGPTFLGHIMEHGRAIGFLMTKILGAHATPKDLEACRGVLKKLHELGMRHGDINRHNFLVSDDAASLIDFDHSVQAKEKDLLEEMRSLDASLSDKSGRGGTLSHG